MKNPPAVPGGPATASGAEVLERNPDFLIVARQFAELTGRRLQLRITNSLELQQTRLDRTFHALADSVFDDQSILPRLQGLSAQWLRRCDCETTRAIAGYTAYLRDDYERAAACFLACIGQNPINLDNWVDLAFSLNHLGDPLGRQILFDHDEFMRRFKARDTRMCSLPCLRAIGREIEEDHAGYAKVWSQYTPPRLVEE